MHYNYSRNYCIITKHCINVKIQIFIFILYDFLSWLQDQLIYKKNQINMKAIILKKKIEEEKSRSKSYIPFVFSSAKL